jgi:hypothetical protein
MAGTAKWTPWSLLAQLYADDLSVALPSMPST